ncbi:MAG: prepilin-type N-terminal cleavage/methylation domain-containing protein, partial [Planctomycetota bacterium]
MSCFTALASVRMSAAGNCRRLFQGRGRGFSVGKATAGKATAGKATAGKATAAKATGFTLVELLVVIA